MVKAQSWSGQIGFPSWWTVEVLFKCLQVQGPRLEIEWALFLRFFSSPSVPPPQRPPIPWAGLHSSRAWRKKCTCPLSLGLDVCCIFDHQTVQRVHQYINIQLTPQTYIIKITHMPIRTVLKLHRVDASCCCNNCCFNFGIFYACNFIWGEKNYWKFIKLMLFNFQKNYFGI